MSDEVLVRVQATPNPTAWKFVMNKPVLLEGKLSFLNKEECEDHPLLYDIMLIEEVKQIHIFQNVITVTHRIDAEIEALKSDIVAIIKTRMTIHDPDINQQSPKKIDRSDLPEEVQEIEAILDRTIRPALQGDGGDLEIVQYKDNELLIFYEGACGTCPSATTGTLMAIEGILRDEFNPEITVTPVGI